MRRATAEEIVNWDELTAANPDAGNVLQTAVYGEFKSAYGWTPHYMVHELTGGTRIAVLYLVRRVPLLGELWYAPKGPGVATVEQLAQVIQDFDRPQAFLLKVEPDLLASQVDVKHLTKLGLVKAKFDLQWNRSTVITELDRTEDELMASFKQKTRYNIRLAERKGVTVRPVEPTEGNMKTMYDLMVATQARNGFYMRDYSYSRRFWEMHTAAGHGQFFFAEHEGKVIAGVFATFGGKHGFYKDGGSTREQSSLQAPALLQWEVMRWLKDHGYQQYDFDGVPPHDRLEDKTHPLAGLVQFKTGFNPDQITEFIGVYDLPLKPAKYTAWRRYGERLVAGISIRVFKKLYY